MTRPSLFLAALSGAVLALAPAASAQRMIIYTDGVPDSTNYSLSAPNDPTTLTIASGAAVQSGVLSGTGGLIKEGAGSITLAATNTFVGPITLNAGTLRLEDSAALGDVANVLTINGGALGNAGGDAFGITENAVVANSDFSIEVKGAAGALEFFGNVHLGAATTRTITLTGEGLACFGGAISGQNLSFVTTAPSSQLMFCDDKSNAFTGTLRIGSGVSLELEKVSDAIAISGDLLIDAGGSAMLVGFHQFALTSDVEVNGTLFASSSGTNRIAALTGTGSIHATEGDTLEVGSGSFSGTITEDSGAGFTLHKIGAGTLTLTGGSSFSGGTLISGGILALGASNALPVTGALTLDGGTFALDGHDQTLGALSLTSDSAIDFNALAADLSFADSSGVSWLGTLAIVNFDPAGNTLRFGTDGTGLTATQLSSLRFASFGDMPGQIDSLGYVTAVPEPGMWGVILAVALLGLVLLRRRSSH